MSDELGQHSAFADELLENISGDYDVDTTELSAYLETPALTVACPACTADSTGAMSAALTRRKGPYGFFAGCTSYATHGCDYTERLCTTCGEGLMQRVSKDHARCNRPGCRLSVPLCACPTPMPMVVQHQKTTGLTLYGCQKYPQAGSCRKTRPIAQQSGTRRTLLRTADTATGAS